MTVKRSKKLKTVATAVFIAVAGICYTFLLPKENPEVEIVKGESDLLSTRLTGTAVPTPTESASASGEAVSADSGASSEQNTVRVVLEPETVNINTADATKLMTLPGIGEVRAKSIIDYRTANGPFKTIEDIMLVKGIKEGVFAKIRDRISTE